MYIVEIAENIARRAHEGQVRDNASRLPMYVHCAEVAAFVAEHGGTPFEIAAAWLHDTVEDTHLTRRDIAVLTNAHIAELVDGLTDPPGFEFLPQQERKSRQAERVSSKPAGVKLIKVADQTSNLSHLADEPVIGWSDVDCLTYIEGAKIVVDACRSECDPRLVAKFDQAYEACVGKYGQPLVLASYG